ncbi:MAG TPA: fibronectin type III domain-containing protein [Kofleriaceae bacterium]|jgi:hypothetical protein
MRTFGRLALAGVVSLGFAQPAGADASRCIDVHFTPSDNLQIVVWLEDAQGNFIDTLFITQQTGSFGLGNRPGRFDFNSGPMWPYGRRINTFPIWSHRNGQSFPSVLFQNDTSQDPNYCLTLAPSDPAYSACGENQLSHNYDNSSHEYHYCRPLATTDAGWDTMTCATATPFTDKGMFSTDPTMNTGYPPRVDVIPSMPDSPSVAMYKAMNPYDAVSQPTPIGGTLTNTPYPVPANLADGNYVMFVEVAKEQDFNDTYTTDAYPSPPQIAYANYGVAYRGQPSVVYQVPFSIGSASTVAETSMYAGYGDPNGADGTMRTPDQTITTDKTASGASRLELVADGSDMYRVRVEVGEDSAAELPSQPASFAASDVTSSAMTMSFVAPGIGSPAAKVAGYEIRVRANDALTADNFEDSQMVTTTVSPGAPGAAQSFDLTGLLPLTDYWIGIRAYDGCHNNGELAIVHVTTADRTSGEVDACFVATAAYGSLLANDVELLRHFRDSMLETNILGELGVEAYYTFGPALAGVIGESDLLRATARDVLRPIVRAVRHLAF